MEEYAAYGCWEGRGMEEEEEEEEEKLSGRGHPPPLQKKRLPNTRGLGYHQSLPRHKLRAFFCLFVRKSIIDTKSGSVPHALVVLSSAVWADLVMVGR